MLIHVSFEFPLEFFLYSLIWNKCSTVMPSVITLTQTWLIDWVFIKGQLLNIAHIATKEFFIKSVYNLFHTWILNLVSNPQTFRSQDLRFISAMILAYRKSPACWSWWVGHGSEFDLPGHNFPLRFIKKMVPKISIKPEQKMLLYK